MIFSPEYAEDIRRYYRNTYVKFKETGDTLFFIKDSNAHCAYGVNEDEVPFELYYSDEFPYEVDYVLPNKAYFQLGSNACLLQRRPAKQYQRGICSENVQVKSLGGTGALVPKGLSFEILKAFVTKQAYYSFTAALSNKEKFSSYALSSRMAYSTKAKHIFIDDVAVASVDTKTKTINNPHSIFLPELSALVQGTKFKVFV